MTKKEEFLRRIEPVKKKYLLLKYSYDFGIRMKGLYNYSFYVKNRKNGKYLEVDSTLLRIKQEEIVKKMLEWN